MAYQVKNVNLGLAREDELLHLLLKQRGVENVESFLNPSPSNINSPFALKNMEAGCQLLKKHLDRKSKILILIDSDVDGYTSASLMYLFIKGVSGIECDYITHENKQHGLHEELMATLPDCDLIICPDSATNDVESCQVLKERGTDVLIIDHHIIERENPYAVVISSADGQYPNPSAVGVMVTYKFCEAYLSLYPHHFSFTLIPLLSLVALGQIADMGKLIDDESRYLTLAGLTQIPNHPFLQALCEVFSYQMNGKMTIDSVVWSLSPALNATIRLGEYEDKIMLFKAFCGIEEDVTYTPRKSKLNPFPVETTLPLSRYMPLKCKRLKAKQDTAVKKGVALIEKQIEENHLNENSVLVVNGKELEQSLTGLVANKLAQKYKKPCVLLKPRNDGVRLGGSARNYGKHPISDFRTFTLESGVMNYSSGHAQSFGLELNAENLDTFITYCNNRLHDVVIEDVWHVDAEMTASSLTERDVLAIAKYDDIWGGGVDRPCFAITNIYLNADDIKLLGEKKNIIRFETQYGNQRLSFIKFFASQDSYNKLIHRCEMGFNQANHRLKLTVIGEFKINEYNGGIFPQIQIVDVQSEIVKECLF